MKNKTVLIAVRVPRYLADLMDEFTKRNDVKVAPLVRYAIDNALGNLDKWSEGDAQRIRNLLLAREAQQAVYQAEADIQAVKLADAGKVYQEMVSDIKAGSVITGPKRKGKK